MVGPWQVPVADCAVTTVSLDSHLGEAMSMGERTPVALLDGPPRRAGGHKRYQFAGCPDCVTRDINYPPTGCVPQATRVMTRCCTTPLKP